MKRIVTIEVVNGALFRLALMLITYHCLMARQASAWFAMDFGNYYGMSGGNAGRVVVIIVINPGEFYLLTSLGF